MATVFISYRRAEPDHSLAKFLSHRLSQDGFEVFRDEEGVAWGERWAEKISKALFDCTYFVILNSFQSQQSDMVTEEISIIRGLIRQREREGQKSLPYVLPIRVQMPFGEDINYNQASMLNRFQQVVWNAESDNETVYEKLSVFLRQNLAENFHSQGKERGNSIRRNDSEVLVAQAALEREATQGKHEGKGYVVRKGEPYFIENSVVESCSRIKGPRQHGKTMLCARVGEYARSMGFAVVSLSFDVLDIEPYQDIRSFLRFFSHTCAEQLGLNPMSFTPRSNRLTHNAECTEYFIRMLNETGERVMIILDSVHHLFPVTHIAQDFFSMLRSWADNQTDDAFRQFRIVLSYTRDPENYEIELNESPFTNIGQDIFLCGLTRVQIMEVFNYYQVKLETKENELLKEYLGGNPYLIRKAAQLLKSGQLTLFELIESCASDEGPFGDHLRRVWLRIKPNQKLFDALGLVISDRSHDVDEMVLHRLYVAGLVNESYRISNKMYQKYLSKRISKSHYGGQ